MLVCFLLKSSGAGVVAAASVVFGQPLVPVEEKDVRLGRQVHIATDENTIELIRVCNEMRKDDDSLPKATRSRLLSAIYFMPSDAVLAKLVESLPADEHLATVNWLAQGIDPPPFIQYILARLSEAVGDCNSAQRLYVSLLSPGMSSRISSQVREGIERCKRTSVTRIFRTR